jgi:hypothetical protein
MRLPANNWRQRGTEHHFYAEIVTDITTRNSEQLVCPQRVWCIVGWSPCQVKPKIIKLVFSVCPLNAQHYGVKAKTGWHGIRIACLSGAKRLTADCCFSEPALYNPTGCVGQYKADFIIISLKNNLFSSWHSWKKAELVLSNNHSLTLQCTWCVSETTVITYAQA